MSRFTSLLLVSLSLSFAATVAAPAVASACGGGGEVAFAAVPTIETQAYDLVSAHFAALSRGDSKGVRALWSPKAKVISYDSEGTAKTSRLAPALRRWMTQRKSLSWEIGAVTSRSDGGADVAITVTWKGAVYSDVLTVMPTENGARITAKSSAPVVTKKAEKVSAY